MIISKLILYPKNDALEPHPLNFSYDKINIIYGDTATGKTSIYDLINYCLGGNNFSAEGEDEITQKVKYVGLILHIKQQYVFIGRSLVSDRTNGFFMIINTIRIPSVTELNFAVVHRTYYSFDIIKQMIAEMLGITEEWNNYNPFTDNDYTQKIPTNTIFDIACSLSMVSEKYIIDKDKLFSNEISKVTMATFKRYFPFFIGIYQKNYFDTLDEKKKIESEKRKKVKERDGFLVLYSYEKNNSLNTLDKAFSLGLIKEKIRTTTTHEKIIQILSIIANKSITNIAIQDKFQKEIADLEIQQTSFQNQITTLRNKITDITNFQAKYRVYDEKVRAHYFRLKSVEIFNIENNNLDFCPLCNQELNHQIPALEAIKNTYKNIENMRVSTKVTEEQINKEIKEYETMIKKIEKDDIAPITKRLKEIEKIRKENQKNKNLNAAQHEIIGISKRDLNSIQSLTKENNLTKLDNEILKIDTKITANKKNIKSIELDQSQKYKNINELINQTIKEYAKNIDWEYKNYRIKLNTKTWLLELEKDTKIIKMNQTRSSQNFRIYHLLFYIALHSYIRQKNISTIPNFLIFASLLSDQEDKERRKSLEVLNYFFKQETETKSQIILIEGSDVKDSLLENKEYNIIYLQKGNGLVPNFW